VLFFNNTGVLTWDYNEEMAAAYKKSNKNRAGENTEAAA
jgi:hypothetical protein